MAEEVIEVLLHSGGSVTLTIEAEWLTMPDRDLEFCRSLGVLAKGYLDPPPVEASPPEVVPDPPAAVKPPPVPKSAKPKPKGGHVCDACGREFGNAAGLSIHVGRTHKATRLVAPPAVASTSPSKLPSGARPKDPFKDEPKRTGLPSDLGPISKTPVPNVGRDDSSIHFVGGRG